VGRARHPRQRTSYQRRADMRQNHLQQLSKSMASSTAITHAARRIELSRALVRSGGATVSSQPGSRDPNDVYVLGLDLDFVGVTLDGAVWIDVASLQLSGEREKFVGVDVGVIVVTHVRVR
jgi:hypothetical protein